MRKLGAFISEVYRIVRDNPSLTAGEIFEVYQTNYPNTKRSRGEISKRLSQLCDRGFIYKSTPKICEYSGSQAATWFLWEVLTEDELFDGPAEKTQPAAKSTCSGCCDCDCDDNGDESSEVVYDETMSLTREEKISFCENFMEEPVVAMDPEDVAVLKECLQALSQLESNGLAKLVVASVPGMKEKAAKLQKALRYFNK